MYLEAPTFFINNEMVEGFNNDDELFDDNEYKTVVMDALNRDGDAVEHDTTIPPVGKEYESFDELWKDAEEYASSTGFKIAKNTTNFSGEKNDVKILAEFFSDVPPYLKVVKRGVLYCTQRNKEMAAMLKMQNNGARLTEAQIRLISCTWRMPFKFKPYSERRSFQFIEYDLVDVVYYDVPH